MGAAMAAKVASDRDLGSIANLGPPVNSQLGSTLNAGEKNFASGPLLARPIPDRTACNTPKDR